MKKVKYPLEHEWHVAINQYHQKRENGAEYERWMYEAKKMSTEVTRLAQLFGKERRGELAKVPIKNNHLKCCLGVECQKCPELLALDQIIRCTPEDVDVAKAWTCAVHIIVSGGDRANEGYVLTVGDRMFWDRVYKNLATHDNEDD